MPQDFTEILRSGYTGLDAHDVLRSPLTILIDVAPAVAVELKKIGISTVFDLGSSWLFANACAACAPRNSATAIGRFGLAPNDWLDANAPAVEPEEIADLGIENLRGIAPADVAVLKTGMNAGTIREFALWPPYQYSAKVISQSYGGTVDPDDLSAESLRPRFGEYPTERIYYKRLVMLDMGLGDIPLKNLNGPVSLKQALHTAAGGQLMRPAVGALLTFSQSWYAQGITLGHMLHSLALAPGECTRVAVVDWSRRTSASTTEMISEAEALDSATQHGRSISEVQSAVANEMQQGASSSWAQASSQSSSGAVSAGTGLLTSLWGSADVSGTTQSSSTNSEAGSSSWSNGTRSVNASMNQEVNDRTQQHSNSVRNRRASIVREVSQNEHSEVSTRIVANYNHMHALTVQYYEVVQIYRVSTELHTAQRCLFIPMELIDFDDDELIDRFRGILMRWALNARVLNLLMDEATAVTLKATLTSRPLIPIPIHLWNSRDIVSPYLSKVSLAEKVDAAGIK